MSQHSKSYYFEEHHASLYGVHEAIMINHLRFLIEDNKMKGRNFIDGRTWTYGTVEKIKAYFPFWSQKQVRTILDSLIKQGVLIADYFNPDRYNRTKWYAFLNEENFISNRGA
jgi:hypothetical protein